MIRKNDILNTALMSKLLGSLLLLLFLLCSFFWGRSIFLWCFFFLFFFLFLLLIHGSRYKQVNNRFCQNITIVIKLKFSKDIIQFILIQFITKCRQDMDKVIFVKNVSLDHLSLNLLLNFFIKSFKCSDNKVIRIIDTTSHLSCKHLDHVVIVAGSANLGQHGVELIVHDKSANIVKSCSEVILADDSIFVNIHQTEAFLVDFKSSFIEFGTMAFSISFSHFRVFEIESQS